MSCRRGGAAGGRSADGGALPAVGSAQQSCLPALTPSLSPSAKPEPKPGPDQEARAATEELRARCARGEEAAAALRRELDRAAHAATLAGRREQQAVEREGQAVEELRQAQAQAQAQQAQAQQAQAKAHAQAPRRPGA